MLRLRTRSMSDGSGIADRNAADIFAYIVADMRGPARLSIPNTPSALFLSVLTSSKMRIYCGASKNHRQREKNSHSRSQKLSKPTAHAKSTPSLCRQNTYRCRSIVEGNSGHKSPIVHPRVEENIHHVSLFFEGGGRCVILQFYEHVSLHTKEKQQTLQWRINIYPSSALATAAETQ